METTDRRLALVSRRGQLSAPAQLRVHAAGPAGSQAVRHPGQRARVRRRSVGLADQRIRGSAVRCGPACTTSPAMCSIGSCRCAQAIRIARHLRIQAAATIRTGPPSWRSARSSGARALRAAAAAGPVDDAGLHGPRALDPVRQQRARPGPRFLEGLLHRRRARRFPPSRPWTSSARCWAGPIEEPRRGWPTSARPAFASCRSRPGRRDIRRKDRCRAGRRDYLLGEAESAARRQLPADLSPLPRSAGGGAAEVPRRQAEPACRFPAACCSGACESLSPAGRARAAGPANAAAALVERHEARGRIRVPQSGWFQEAGPDRNRPGATKQEPRGSRFAIPTSASIARPALIASTTTWWTPTSIGSPTSCSAPSSQDIDLYHKPMARNVQLWDDDFQPLLDGPTATARHPPRRGDASPPAACSAIASCFPPCASAGTSCTGIGRWSPISIRAPSGRC